MFAAEQGKAIGVPVFLDLDLRPDQWSHPHVYGLKMRALLPYLDVVIGTEEEMYAALDKDPAGVAQGRQLSNDEKERLDGLIISWLNRPETANTFILKRGPEGARVFQQAASPIDVPGFPVQVLNTVGAGDAFAAGLIYGYLAGWSWSQAVRMGNACGAIVVTRHGCAAAMPTKQEALALIGNDSGI